MDFFRDIFASGGPDIGSSAITVCLVAGACIAVVAASVSSLLSGKIIRTYSRQKIYTPEESLSLKEIGLGKRFMYGFLLRERSPLRRYMRISNEDECVSKGKPDLRVARLYLIAEKEAKALTIYGEKEPNLLLILLATAMLIATAVAALIFLPSLLAAAANLFK